MFGIGLLELLVIFIVALLVLGPDKLPPMARKIAQFLNLFREAGEDLRLEMMSAPGSPFEKGGQRDLNKAGETPDG